MLVLVWVLCFVDVKNLALRNCFQSSAWLHQASMCHIHLCSVRRVHPGCIQRCLQKRWIALLMAAVCLSLPAALEVLLFLAQVLVKSCAFPLLWSWSPGHVKLDAHLHLRVSGVMCAHEWFGASTKGFIYPASVGSLWCDREVWKKAGNLFSCVLTTEVVSPSRNNWWELMSLCHLFSETPLPQISRSKRFCVTSWLAGEQSEYCPIYAATVKRIVLFLGESAEYFRLLPWCWMYVSLEFISGV